MTAAIERQIERFAPGFADLVLARATRGPAELEADNPNYVGGDINGGVADLRQMLGPPGSARAIPTRRRTRGCISARRRRRPAAVFTACAATTPRGPHCAARSGAPGFSQAPDRRPYGGGIASCRQMVRTVPAGTSRCRGTGARRS